MFSFREYQKPIVEKGISILKTFNVVYLAMEVRTGKTLTAFGIASGVNVTNVLFVTKKKIIESGTILNDYNLINPKFDLQIINPESLHKIKDNTFDLYIVDEAHQFGTFPKPSQRIKVLRKMIGSKKLILLSGTPTPESWSQIFNQFNLTTNSPFEENSFYKWANKYVNVKKKKVSFGQTVNDYSDANIELIKSVTDKVIISFTQKEGGFKSSVIESVLTVPMSKGTNDLIMILKKSLVYENKDHVILADTPVKLMSKIHQINSGTVKTEAGEGLVLDYSKGYFIRDRFAGSKIAIYYKFSSELVLLKRVFGDKLTTDLNVFNNNQGINIALQIVSGSEGISLKLADYIVYFNIDFSAVTYWQSRDRMTTIERSSNYVYWVFAEGGIEFDIYKTVIGKKSFTLAHFQNIESNKQITLNL